MVHDFIDHFVKFKHETDAVMALCREVYQDMQKKGRAIKDHLFFTKSSAPSSAMHSTSFSHPYYFQPECQ